MPSNPWIRWRAPSITLKCTATVPPALNTGISVRSCRCSRLWMTVLMGQEGEGRAAMLAKSALPISLVERDAVGGPVGHEDLADDVLARDGPPEARVT